MRRREARRYLPLVFVGPGLLLLVVFLLGPLVQIAVMSVLSYSPTKIFTLDPTLQNYARFADTYYLGVTWTTVRIGLYTTLACAAMGYPIGYFLARSHSRWLGFFLFLLVAPLMVSSVIRVFGWIVILGRRGLLNDVLRLLGLGDGVELLYNTPAVVVGLTQLLLPFMVLPLMSSLESIHPSVEEAARNLGANWLQLFRRVILPLTLPGLVSGSLLVYTVAISALVTPALMGGRAVRMLGNAVYDEVLTSFNWPFASTIAMVLLTFTGLIMFLYLRTMRSLGQARLRT